VTSIRLLALDIDGTILLPDGSLSQRVKRAIGEAQARGIVVALATARRWHGARALARELGLTGALILYDGALICDAVSGVASLRRTLDPAQAQVAAQMMGAHELQVIAQYRDAQGERLLVSADPPHPQWTRSYLERFAQQTTYFALDDLAALAPQMLRLCAFGQFDPLRVAFDALGESPLGRQIMPMGSYDEAELTVFAPEASKGEGMRWLAQRLDIPLAQTMAMGDGVNDISMLQAAGLGVAMGNAAPEVRLAANVVTADNAEDGAALAIERYALDEDAPWPDEDATERSA
jgi:Cof subfamily protein (haloacid dehalogenase superfamily)